ncbi:MAG: PKD domain-containing protein [Bacteroidetes bacterium]|nr:PKD domain-containing protein [Bacteroidota bacterium]
MLNLFIYLIQAQHNIAPVDIQKRNTEQETFTLPRGASASSSAGNYSTTLRGSGMMFTQNKGQIIDMNKGLRPDILYKGEGGGADIYIRKTGVSYVLSNEAKVMHEIKESLEEKEKSGSITTQEAKKLKQELEEKALIKLHRTDIDFVNGNPNPDIITANQVEGVTNYYFEHCPQGITGVRSFNEVTVKNIYDNIDVKYYGEKTNGLKYDIIVNPGGDPNQIQLRYSGADALTIKNGELKIKNSVGEITEQLPKVYQNINGQIVDVRVEYKLTLSQPVLSEAEGGRAGEGLVRFSFSDYNSSFPLVIDPWASYYSGNYGELGFSVTTDPFGNIAFSGQARSSNLPTSPGAFQTVAPAGRNVFAVKMTSTGARIWGTYYGGTGTQAAGWGISGDAAGNILVAVSNAPATLPMGATAGNVVQQPTGVGGALVKFDPLLGQRVWSTFYGSSASYGNDVVTDGNNVYLYGPTTSASNISTAGTFQFALNGASDVFVAKFASNGSLIWGTYVGGSGDETCGGIAYNTLTSSIYIGGYTTSTNFPATIHQPGYGGATDAFIFKLNPAGGQVWGTYYGGSGSDYGTVIATDGLGNVIIGGITGSNNSIASAGSYQPVNGGGAITAGTNDGFLAKFNSAGVRQWGTYFGGNRWELVNGLDVDATNKIYISGEFEDADSGNYPISVCAYQPVFAGHEDAYIARYDPNGKQLCITYYGGSKHDEAAFDNSASTGGGSLAIYGNNLHIVGCTEGSFPVTPGAFQTAFGGPESGFVEFNEAYIAQLCINICEGVSDLNFTAVPNSVCNNTPITFTPSVSNVCDTSGYKFQWTFSGASPASSTAIKPTVTYSTPGNYPVKLVLTTACKKDSLTQTVVVNSSCVITAAATSSTICPNSCTNITANGANGTAPYTYNWSTGATTQTINVCPATNTNYLVTITDASGNSASAPASVIIRPPLITTPSSTNITCTVTGSAGITVNSGSVPYTYNWSNGATTSSIQNIPAGNYTVTVTDGKGCTKTNAFTITSSNPASATFTSTPACVGGVVNFVHTGSAGTYYWSITPTSPAVSGTTMNFSYTFLSTGTYTVTHNTTNAGCSDSKTATVTVSNCTGPTVTATGSSVCPGACAAVTSSGANGTSPYTYSWSNGSTTQNINPCPISTTTYTVTIRDIVGNSSTSTAIVTVHPAVTVLITPTNINCSGASTGSAAAAGSGGSAPYTYNWSGGVPGTGFQVSGLSAGTYTVTVTDNKGCSSISTTTITSPLPLSGQFTKGTSNCTGCGCKEWLMVNATGGSSPYSYSWPDGYVNRYKSQLCPGAYNINITDKNGCSININLTAP